MTQIYGGRMMGTNGLGSISIDTDLVFGTGDGRDLKCDVYRPADAAEKRTAIIHLHGGGWRRATWMVLSHGLQVLGAVADTLGP